MGSCLKKSKQGKKRKCLAKKTPTEGFGATEKLPPSTKIFIEMHPGTHNWQQNSGFGKTTLKIGKTNSLVKI